MTPGWGKVSAAAKYAGISPRTLEDWLKNGMLRYSQLPSGTRLIKFDWIDEALEKFIVQPEENPVTRIVDDMMQKISRSN